MNEIGKSPDPQEARLIEAAAEISPKNSFERIDNLARFVFSNVAVIGTLLAGLGLFTDLGHVIEATPAIGGAPLPVLLLGASLVLATVALFPGFVRFNLSDLTAVRAWYRRQVLRRGWAVRLSLAAFGAAIAVAALGGFSDPPRATNPSLSGSWNAAGDQATATIRAEIADLEPGSKATARIIGISGEESQVLFRSRDLVERSGALKVEAELSDVQRFRRIAGTIEVENEGEQLVTSLLTLYQPR